MSTIELVQSVDNGGNLQQSDTSSYIDSIRRKTAVVISIDLTVCGGGMAIAMEFWSNTLELLSPHIEFVVTHIIIQRYYLVLTCSCSS